MQLRLFLRRVIKGKLVLRKTGRLIPYRLSRFRDFIFQLFGIIGVVVGRVAGIWIAEVLRQLTSRQYCRFEDHL